MADQNLNQENSQTSIETLEIADSIVIKKIIAHNLNLANELDGPITSNFCLKLDKEELISFFKTHLQTSRNSSNTKRCTFIAREINQVRDSITQLTEHDLDSDDFTKEFIKLSKELVHFLFNCMLGKSKSDGSFIFIEYTDNEEYFLAILKMDINKNFRLNISDEGVPEVELLEKVLPSLNEKLHKAAFIKLLNFDDNDTEDNIHLFVLDKQRAGRETSDFFLNTFLAAKTEANSETMTLAVQNAITDTVKRMIKNDVDFPEFNMKSFFDFQNSFNNKLAVPGTFNLDEDFSTLMRPFVSDSIDLTPQIKKIKQKVAQKINNPVYNFEIFPEAAKDIVYKTDSDSVKISIAPTLNEGTDFIISKKGNKTIFEFDQTVQFKDI